MADLQTSNIRDGASSIAMRPSVWQRVHVPALPRVATGFVFVALLQIVGGLLLTPQGALLVVGPISLFALPVLGTVADFVLPRMGKRYSGWAVGTLMSAIIVIGGIVLTLLAQAVVGHIDLAGAFSPDPAVSARHLATFPFTIPLGAFFFVSYLEVAIVSGVPMWTKHRTRDGVLAFVGCVVAALVLYQVLANWAGVPPIARAALGLRNPGGPFDALDLAGMLISITIWQVLYLFLGGWPLQAARVLWQRILLSNVAVIGLGLLTYGCLHGLLHLAVPQVAVIGAMIVVGVLVVGILLGLPAAGPPEAMPASRRSCRLGLLAAVALLSYFALYGMGTIFQPHWTIGTLELWMTICGLNLIGGGIMLYCRILRPMAPPAA